MLIAVLSLEPEVEGFERRSKYAAEAISVDHVESLVGSLAKA